MQAIVTVVGHDKVGIIAGVSKALSEKNVNILDVSQTTMQDYFTMMMLVDIPDTISHFAELADYLEQIGGTMDVSIRIQRTDIFDAMHKI